MKKRMHLRATTLQSDSVLLKAFQDLVHSKSLRFLVLYGVANMVIGVETIAIAMVLLPMHIASMTQSYQTSIFAVILAIGAVAAVLTNLLAGMLCDQTTSPLGRRRPWLITGGVLTVGMLLLLAVAPSLPVVTIEWIFLQIGMSFVQVMLSALLPDQISIRQRATVSAFTIGLGTLLAGLFGHLLVAQFFTAIPAAYTTIAVMIAMMIAVFLLVLRDAPLPKEYVPPFHLKNIPAAYWLNPMTHPDFALAWLARCLLFVGSTTAVNVLFSFLKDAVHSPLLFSGSTIEEEVHIFFGVNVGFILVISLFAGMLSDKLQRRKGFVMLSSFMIIAGLVLYVCFPTWSMVIVATGVLGMGMGIFLSVDLALASQLLPTVTDRGKDIGLINTAIFLSMILSPMIAGIIPSTFHRYLILFSFLAVATLIAASLSSVFANGLFVSNKPSTL